MVNNVSSNRMISEPLKCVDASSLNIRSISITRESNSAFNNICNTKKNQKHGSSSIKFLETLSRQSKTLSTSMSLQDANDENSVDRIYIGKNDIDDNLNSDSECDESFYSWSPSSLEYQHLILPEFRNKFCSDCQLPDSISRSELSMTSCENSSCKTKMHIPLNLLETSLGSPGDSVKDMNLKVQAFHDNENCTLFSSVSGIHTALQLDEKNEKHQSFGKSCHLDKIECSSLTSEFEIKNRKRIVSDISSNSDTYGIDGIQDCKSDIRNVQKGSIGRNINRKFPGLFLSEEQKTVLRIVVEEQKSIFFTGSAGTGKSILLREIIASLRKKYSKEPDRVAITASTGLAACNIGGVTLHSYAGIGLGRDSSEDLCKKIRRNKKCLSRWLRTKVLVIDEISMVDAELFDKLENIARKLRNNENSFGGIQVIVTGDFFQLPPVPDQGKMAKFAFEAEKWKDVISHTIALTHRFSSKGSRFC
ncbi:unnamed protein product [Pneumocystis jirovecii]|uniref:ATP-dependent DNA helicase n=1 Tax=Pneumocystis jirovecii TaxID=42068 RepID=L0PB01_PNEJI|nr:unnamed protein product [Pneumocystis jirovecii]